MNIAVLVSGGVDSAVALHKIAAQSTPLAIYLKIWLNDADQFLGTHCPWEEDLSYARATAEAIGVPLEVIDLQREYYEYVVEYVINEVRHGFTPNPDIFCNTYVKFGACLDIIGSQVEYVATGHYAHVVHEASCSRLFKAPDAVKDQAYFLSRLRPDQLSRALFPLGEMHKSEVREYAQKYNLPPAQRKDSQGICFLGKLKFREFLEHYIGTKEGKLVEYETGKIVGAHKGFWFYTNGQRQGIGLSGGPWYVVSKNPAENTVFISKNYYAADHVRNIVYVADFKTLCVGNDIPEVYPCSVKLRHGPAEHTAIVRKARTKAIIELERDDQGIAPGQFAVLYKNNECIGSGKIITQEEYEAGY